MEEHKNKCQPWVFWKHPTLSSDFIRSTPVTPETNFNDLVIKEKIKCALESLNLEFDYGDDDGILFQFWAPVTIEGRCFLTTSDQPFALTNFNISSLWSYRRHSLDFKFMVDDGVSEENIGLLGRVFRTKLPELTPDVRYYSSKEYPHRYHAVNCNLHRSFSLPVFKNGGQVVGVLEVIFSMQNFTVLIYDLILAAVYKAIKGVCLGCLGECPHFGVCQDIIDEINEVFELVCNTHKLPFARTWVLCTHCSEIVYGDGYVCQEEEILSTLTKAYYTSNDNMFEFVHAPSYLKKGQGVPGKAYVSHNSCFCRDVTQLNMFQYPSTHFARHFGLAGCFAICLQSTKTGDRDYVLEFFIPPSESNCEDPIKTLLDPIMVTMKQHFRSFKLSSGKELGDELSAEVIELDMCAKLGSLKLCQTTRFLPRSEPLQNGRETMEVDLSHHQPMVENEAINKERIDNVSAGKIYADVPSEKEAILVDTTIDKDHLNNEVVLIHQLMKTTSLQDAAKILGVSRSTLKRKCRDYGIKRWIPQRGKSKNQSLQEATRHINESVQDDSRTMDEKHLKPQQLPTTYEIKVPQLTQHEMEIVDYIFDSSECIGETLVRYPLEHATRKDMYSLRAGKWLDDVIINLMVSKLMFEQKRSYPDLICRAWYLPTYVAQQILGEGAQVSTMAKQYFGPNRYSGPLSACEKVFIPINERSEHWFLCVIDMQQGVVNILDPLVCLPSYEDREEMVGQIVNFMDKLLAHLHGDVYKSRIVDFLPIQRLGWVPQQKNLHDCGLFIIKFMECQKNFHPGVQFTFDSEHARAKIAVDLVLEEHNIIRHVVLDKVQRHKPRKESR